MISGGLTCGKLRTTDGAVQITEDDSNRRSLSNKLGADGTTAYFSFLIRPDDFLLPHTSVGLGILGASPIFVGKPSVGASSVYVMESFGGGGQQVSRTIVAKGQTTLLVIRTDFASGADALRLYVDPTPGDPEPLTADAKLTGYDLQKVNALEISRYGGSTVATFDEVRVGGTFADVTPVVQ